MKVGYEVEVREPVKVLQPGGKFRDDHDLAADRPSGHGLQRHPLEGGERRPHDADGSVTDRLGWIGFVHLEPMLTAETSPLRPR